MNKKHISESKVFEILKERYANDSILVIATAKDNVPSMRCVDTFYYEDSFWIVSSLHANYVKEIQSNKHVMISDAGHNRLWCHAEVIGHPLEEKNLSIREIYMKVFHHWYKEVNDESLDSTCFIKVTPYKGYIHKDKLGYKFDVIEDIVSVNDITHHIDVKLEPFW